MICLTFKVRGQTRINENVQSPSNYFSSVPCFKDLAKMTIFYLHTSCINPYTGLKCMHIQDLWYFLTRRVSVFSIIKLQTAVNK